DIIARIVAQKLSPRLGQQIVIENRAGASGNIGADAVAKAAPDGYTIGIATASTHAVAASLNANLPYDPVKDFAPVAMIGSQPYVLVLHPALPARNLAELIALAKAKPGTLNYGSAGVASLAHLANALFASMAGVNIVHVPYKSSSQSMTDMITGRLDMQFANIAPSLPNIRAGQLRALATSGKTRVAALPELPTVAEAGLAGYEAALWVSFVMPSAAPPTIIARLNREVNEILGSADGKAALVAQGMESEPGLPAAVSERIRSDIRKWREGAASARIHAEEHPARRPRFRVPTPRPSPQGKRAGHREGRNAGDFHWVHNIAADSKGNLYTTEVDTGKRAQKFRHVGPPGRQVRLRAGTAQDARRPDREWIGLAPYAPGHAASTTSRRCGRRQDRPRDRATKRRGSRNARGSALAPRAQSGRMRDQCTTRVARAPSADRP